MRFSLSAALWLVATALFSLSIHAQIETPAEFLGYELGDRFTRHQGRLCPFPGGRVGPGGVDALRNDLRIS